MPRTGSILVVDSEAVIAELLVEFLTEEGYLVSAAMDGPGALAAILQQVPELILCDLVQTSRQGTQFIEQVCADGRTTSIVIMSTDEHLLAQPLMRGVAACIGKPFDLSDLLACVARYVRPADGRALEAAAYQ